MSLQSTQDSEALFGHADIDRTIRAYARDFWRAFWRNPLHQIARVLRRRAREAARLRSRPGGTAQMRDGGTVRVPAMLRPPSYSYRGFSGPWLEEHFYSTWQGSAACRRGEFRGAAYVPIFFDSLFFHAQCHSFLPAEFRSRYLAMWSVLNSLRASPRAYFTLKGMYEFPIWDWHLFPRNVIVLASAGFGDIAIPLLKGDRPLVQRPKDIRLSFMGALSGVSNALNVREEMRAVFADSAVIGEGDNWAEVMARSTFSLCPRGQGPTSFRIFEALSMTSIPVYIWKQRCWLPYADELDWTSFAVVVEAAQMQKAKRRVFDLPANEIQEIQARIAKLYQKYFSYDGVCAYIRRKMEAIPDREPAEAVTAGRDQF